MQVDPNGSLKVASACPYLGLGWVKEVSICDYQKLTEAGWAAVGTEFISIHSKVLVKHYKLVLKTQMGLFCARSEWFPWGYGRNSAKKAL